MVPLVVEGRRRRDAQRAPLREQVDRLLAHLPVAREPLDRRVGEEVAQRRRLHDRAREEMGAGRATLLEHRQGHLSELFGGLGVVPQELPEPDRRREAGRAGADDEDADVDPLVLRRRRLGDELGRRERRRMVGGPRHRP
jgi:hypothetical protein